jgi:tight adherence protein C
MELLAIFILLFAGVGLLAYQLSIRRFVGEVHLPSEIHGRTTAKAVDFKDILNIPASFVEQIIKKGGLPLDNLRKKLVAAGRPVSANQFLTLKFMLTVALPTATFIALRPEPAMLAIPLLIGFAFPDIWLNNLIKKRNTLVLRDLPHVIDLLNICVGAGLDFMVAVGRVTEEFRQGILTDELKVLMHEIQMGSSRRDALKNLASRINSPEVVSFARTLVQADRMGTPIGEALKMQAEEIRLRRFQRGEEMALKAPIKLLFPLLIFIMPVVLIIVAGPILIQFTHGGIGKF